MDEEKRVVIQPLPDKPPAEPQAEEKQPRKAGRKRTKPKKEGPKKPISDAKRQQLLKARLARSEKRKKQLKEIAEKKKRQEEVMRQFDAGQLVPTEKNLEDKLHQRLTAIENALGSVNSQMGKLIMAGLYHEPTPKKYTAGEGRGDETQAEQTIVQTPTELKHADITKPAPSVVQIDNGGQRRMRVRPDNLNLAPVGVRDPAGPADMVNNSFFF